MTSVAIVGGSGSPGASVTALALMLNWPLVGEDRVVLLEADPDGGMVHPGTLQGRELGGDYGMHNLGLAHRQGNLDDFFFRQMIDFSGEQRRMVVPGFAGPEQAAMLTHTWEPLATLVSFISRHEKAHDVIIDLGRSGARGEAAVLAHRADLVAVVVRGTLRSVAAAEPRIAALRRDLDRHGTGADMLGLIVVAEGPYSVGEVGRALGAPVWAVLPHDPKTAAILSEGTGAIDERALQRPLMKAVRTGADELRVQARDRARRMAVPQSAGGEVRGD